MPDAPILPIFAMTLLLAVLIYKLLRGPTPPRTDAPKSTLARDGGLGSVGFLIPTSQRDEVKALRAGKSRP